MTADASTLVIPGKGTVFTAAAGVKPPADPFGTGGFTLTGTPPTGWKNLGHTSKANTIAFSKEGGEKESIDTFLADAVRVVYSAAAWSVTIPALQFDQDVLDLAFNGDWDDTTGGYIIPGSSAPTEAALFLYFKDNTGALGFWIPNTSVTLGEPPSVDTAAFMELPLAAAIQSAAESIIPAVDGRPGIMELFKTGLVKPTP
ncbi:hypothetical protein ACFWGP_05355 [Agromyces sp. NPDC127015]|uniref:phage tail tube protein n=1 Tax=Agromyces sp. NPDC127015 TaxID=3347108 RepID=UPI003655924A